MANKVVERMALNTMPYDRWDAESHRHIHSTGYMVFFADGTSAYEYEDCIYEDAENCKLSNESDYEEE